MTSDQTMRALADAATQGPWSVLPIDIGEEVGWPWVWQTNKLHCFGGIVKLDGRQTLDGGGLDYAHGAIGSVETTDMQNPEVDHADAEFIAAAREWVPDAIRRIKAVRELHWGDVSVGIHAHICAECRQEYPCPTIRALDGEV